MPDTKLIFLDIDGTLVRAGENTPPDSAEAPENGFNEGG